MKPVSFANSFASGPIISLKAFSICDTLIKVGFLLVMLHVVFFMMSDGASLCHLLGLNLMRMGGHPLTPHTHQLKDSRPSLTSSVGGAEQNWGVSCACSFGNQNACDVGSLGEQSTTSDC